VHFAENVEKEAAKWLKKTMKRERGEGGYVPLAPLSESTTDIDIWICIKIILH